MAMGMGLAGMGGGGAAPAAAPQVAPATTPGQASPYQIGGQLPFQGGGASMFAGGGLAGLGASYASAYNSALQMNQQNYNNILAGYQQTAGNQLTAQQAVMGGYKDLTNQVLGGIQGIGRSQQQAINDTYAQQAGTADQDLINRGLGNTTVQSSVNRGLVFDREKANVALQNQLAALTAGYQTNLGLAGLNYQGQAQQANTGLAMKQLDWMNSVKAGYPDAGAYSALAQQYGQAQQQRDFQNQYPVYTQGNGYRGGGGVGPIANDNSVATPTSHPEYGAGGIGGWSLPSAGGGGYNASPTSWQPSGAVSYGTGPTGSAQDFTDYGAYGWAGGPTQVPDAGTDYGAYGWAGGPTEPPPDESAAAADYGAYGWAGGPTEAPADYSGYF